MNKLKRSIIITFLLITSSSFAAKCFNIDTKEIQINWTAYKTPAKAGVSGSLRSFKLKTTEKSKPIRDIIKSANISIDSSSVFTKNPERDKKIVKFFFMNAKDQGNIKASIKKMSKKSIEMSLSFNGVTKTIPLSYAIKNNTLIANGHMDILDFMASKSLKAINKACFALHKGKTWSDVALKLTAKFKPCS